MADVASQTERSAAEAARAWRANLPRDRRRASDLRGGVIFAFNIVIYALLFVGVFLAPTWWLCLACFAVLPFSIGAMFVIGHDAAHFTLVRSYWLNRVLGRLALLPAYHPY